MAPKNADIFYCKECDFKCSKHSDWKRHILTAKHKNRTLLNDFTPITPKTYICEHCDRVFNARNSLWYHKQKCSQLSNKLSSQEDTTFETTNSSNITIVMDLLKQNQELQKQLIDVVKLNGPSVQNQTINNNQKFNLNFFLNEQCKDAMNINDFIDSLHLDPSDIAETGRLGYVEGISRIFINKLNELDMYSRPLHCTDLKRETLYIKEDNKWEKDNEQKEKLKSIVTQIAEKNYQQLPLWQSENPSHMVTDTPECELFMDIACNSLGGGSSEESNRFNQRIMRNVLKEITLSKLA